MYFVNELLRLLSVTCADSIRRGVDQPNIIAFHIAPCENFVSGMQQVVLFFTRAYIFILTAETRFNG
jgi:hypothetical protein